MFDVNLDEVTVTLSFLRWLDGKGLIKDAKVKGVRGVIDRRSVWWDTSLPLIPEEWRHEVHPGDFEFESLQVEDALLTVYQPGGQRPYNVSVFNAAIGPFRKRYLFYDMMAAEAITGQFDNCLFSLHMPQKLGKMAGVEEDGIVKRMVSFPSLKCDFNSARGTRESRRQAEAGCHARLSGAQGSAGYGAQ